MVLACFGVLTWLIHAVRLCAGGRPRPWVAAWFVGLPVLCVVDYAISAAVRRRSAAR